MNATSSPSRVEIAFVFDNLPDWQQLAAAVSEGVQVVVLSGARDGLVQIAEHLQGREGVDAIHILSHGQPGSVQLGTLALDQAALAGQATVLGRIGAALSDDGDILLYGCNLAEGETGIAFIHKLAAETGADIAASTDGTGSSTLGGNWTLETHIGTIDSHSPFSEQAMADYEGLLTLVNNGVNGTIGWNGISNGVIAGASTGQTPGGLISVTDHLTSGLDIYAKNNSDPSSQNLTIRNQPTGMSGATDPAFVRTVGTYKPEWMELRSNQGIFDLESIKVGSVDSISAATYNFTLQALDSSFSPTGAAVTLNDVASLIFGTFNVSANTDFDGIYGVRITVNTGLQIAVDDIAIINPRLPDTTPPTVTGVTSSTSDGTYKVGDSISLQVHFSENVIVASGTPQLTLETGTTDRTINYTSGTGTGTSTLTFTYTVQVGDITADLDYLATNALALNAATIRDAAGNNAVLTLPSPGAANSLGNNKAIVIDGAVPTATSVNASTDNGTYKVGDTISIQVNFSEAVTVTGTPQLTLETGATDRTINYTSGSGTSTLSFAYTVQAGDASADLDYVATSSLALNGGTIRDAAGNDATLTLAPTGAANSLGNNKAIVIDGMAPTATSVTSSTANGTYKVGDTISIQVNFSEAVTVTGTPQLTLETGATDRTINYTSGSGTSTLSFTYTVQAGDTSADLDYLSTTPLALNGGTIRDAAGNEATLSLASPGATNSLGNNQAIIIDGELPSVISIIPVGSTPTNASSLDYAVTFSESVSGVGTSDFSLTKTETAKGTISSISGTSTTYYVTVTGITGSGTLRLDLNDSSTGIVDAPGNAIAAGFTSGQTYTIDTESPAVTSVSVPANATYVAGQNLDFTVTFSENVMVTGSDSTLGLTVGSITRDAVFLLSSSSTVTYRYTVQSGDADANGITLGSLVLGSSTIRDAAGNAASLTLNSVGTTSGILVDGTVPSVSGTVAVPGNQTYLQGEILSFTVTFDENVTFSGSPSTLSLTIGSTARNAAISATTGNSVTYTYTVQASDVDADGIAITGIALNGGTIRDAVGNDANLSLTGHLPSLTGVQVNGGPAVVSGNVAVPANGTYVAGQTLSFTVSFDRNVDVAGTDSVLGLTIGSIARDAVFDSKNANSVTYAYTLQAGDLDADGIEVGVITLNTSTIRDTNGIDAVLALAGHLPLTIGIIVGAPPTQPAPPPPAPPPVTIDGAQVTTSIASDGSTITTITPVATDRVDDPGTTNNTLADVTLLKGGDGHIILQVGLPVGVGLQAQGQANAVSGNAALTELVQRIQNAGGSSDVVSSGQLFTSGLSANSTIHVQAITINTGAGFDPAVPLVISGSSLASDGQQAIILDARALPSGTLIQVDNIEFIAVVGAVRLIGGAGQNFASGDGSAQWIVLGADDDVLHGGGGNDIVGSLGGNDQVFGDAGDDIVFGGTGNDTLSGGSGNDRLDGGLGWDTALQSGSLADYTLSQDGNALVLTHKTTGEIDHLKSVEMLKFDAGFSLYIADSDAEAAIAHIAAKWLGRDLTADEGAQFQDFSHLTPLEVAQAVLRGPYASQFQGHTAQELIDGWQINPQILRMDVVSEFVQGSAATDAVSYGLRLADGHLQRVSQGIWEGTSLLNGDMVQLHSIERMHFTDASAALDGDNVAALITVTLGGTSLQNRAITSEGLALMDSGWSNQDIGAAALKLAMGEGTHTAQDTVQWLWTKAHGSAGTNEQLQPYVQQLQAGSITVGDLAWEAAQYALVNPQVALTGVLQQGLVYDAVTA